ncbi:Aste57867_13778 [Aphanomyces stellatus]|uniref:Aste57867_13778 protein n=1 Tax=Aphanomyces stellatus TaxID=120398 RepID=A0A485KZJ8_9STRA|nr:hypothetical protein As57867_013728 [Aphanomyces stellatus]VFT90611.1 Aste57867_13778 [Aphanomyces stellatus]
MAFSMKLKGAKKPGKVAAPANPMQASHPVFGVDDIKTPVLKKGSKLLPPPMVVAQSRPGVLSKAERAAQDALADDPNVFDYDGMYDNMQAERQKQKEAKKVQGVPQSKYIGALMEKAKIREIEHDRIRERRLLKERAEDDALHGDKEKFVTASYKRKLMESKRWEQEDARLAAIEAANDVTKKEHGMAGFYANLLTSNIAMGGDVSKAVSAYTTGQIKEGPPSTAVGPTDETPPSPKRQKVAPPVAEKQAVEGEPTAQPIEKDATVGTPVDTRPEPVAVRSRDDIIRAAKERYLARKQQASAES